jgi:hypothetical protein
MKLSTAIRQLDSQAAWLGISGTELLKDIKKHGKIVYSDRVVLAYKTYCMYTADVEELLV